MTTEQPDKAKRNPKFIGELYSYRTAVVNNLSRNLMALGLEKVPPRTKTLDEILNEPDEPEQDKEPES